MNPTGGQTSTASDGGALALLGDLCGAFAPRGFLSDGEVVHADALPAPADMLLVHHNHMTVQLQRHHGKPVEVRVLEEIRDGEFYARRIVLTLEGTDTQVESGIARINFRHLPEAVRDEILAKQTPLGAILIKHNVHRRVKPRYFVRFPARSRVIELLGGGGNAAPVFGRLGTIYCNGEPAIELLEIVVNTEVRNHP